MQISPHLINNNILFSIKPAPSITQTFCGNTTLDFPDEKQADDYSCAPVSATNSMIWLSKNGFPGLYTNESPSSLVNELSKYFKLVKSRNHGTTTDNMCIGLENCIKDKGYKASRIEYQGLRPTEDKYKTSMLPDIEKIKSEIKKGNIVFLNLGIYEKKNNFINTDYVRQYGHCVLAVGAGNNGFNSDNDYITIHDPYSKVNGDIYIKPKKIESGKFIHNKDDNEKTLRDDATGFYELTNKFDYFKNGQVAVINGAIILEMDKTSKQ